MAKITEGAFNSGSCYLFTSHVYSRYKKSLFFLEKQYQLSLSKIYSDNAFVSRALKYLRYLQSVELVLLDSTDVVNRCYFLRFVASYLLKVVYARSKALQLKMLYARSKS